MLNIRPRQHWITGASRRLSMPKDHFRAAEGKMLNDENNGSTSPSWAAPSKLRSGDAALPSTLRPRNKSIRFQVDTKFRARNNSINLDGKTNQQQPFSASTSPKTRIKDQHRMHGAEHRGDATISLSSPPIDNNEASPSEPRHRASILSGPRKTDRSHADATRTKEDVH